MSFQTILAPGAPWPKPRYSVKREVKAYRRPGSLMSRIQAYVQDNPGKTVVEIADAFEATDSKRLTTNAVHRLYRIDRLSAKIVVINHHRTRTYYPGTLA